MKKKLPEINILNDNKKNLKKLLKDRLSQLGDFSFTDDSWYCRKRHKDSLTKGCYTLTFYQVPDVYKYWVKYYALLCESSVSGINKKCLSIAKFLNFIHMHYPGLSIDKINKQHVNAFEYELKLSDRSNNNKQFIYSSIQDFFSKLSNFSEMPNTLPTRNINPFRQESKKLDDKMIPENVVRKWDRAFKDESLNIPLEFRTLYWLLRSFPNRITEILSMERNCLRSFYSEYVIRIPSFKQDGGYDRGEPKLIPVIYNGHGKYVIDLIKRLQLQTEQLAIFPSSSQVNKEYLFIVQFWGFFNNHGDIGIRFDPRYKGKVANWEGWKINRLLKQLAQILNIRNDNNELIIPTTHQFRHNAVTDRQYVVGYTTEQIRRLTGHKNEAMTKYYTHQLIKQHKEIHLNISGLRNPKNSPCEYRGKILNLDNRTIQQLSKNPKRYLTWEANGKKGVGICSDISGCNPKGTPVHFECYACDWFVPKLDYYDDYVKEYDYWQEIIERTSQDPKRVAHFENAVRNLSYLERIIAICENGIEQFKEAKLNIEIENNTKLYKWE
ncbi:site-specific integrase [Lysinibacillus fusiformis]|uniref:site-specific integrase n=1 Tax=Lysinibacillus fusiformis TaxID=28031 RepID=UPI0035BF6AD9|nr:site-specific integrase [Lysinibacillus fusiformis]